MEIIVGQVCPVVREYGLVGLLVLVVVKLFLILLDEDQSALWRGRLYKILHAVTRTKDAEKKYIANDINGRINLARRKLHFGKEILARSVKVEWVSNGGNGAYNLKEGEFVVRLDPSACQERNIVRLAAAVVQRTSCLGIRHLMEKPMIDAVDLNLVRNILRQLGDRKVLDWFFENEYTPSTTRDAKLNEWNRQIVEIDERGLFTTILLLELDHFAMRIHGMTPRLYMTGEIEGLVSFLFRIATKELNQDVPLDYCKAYIRIGVLLVARTSKLLSAGIEPYVRAMHHVLEKQLDAVYVIISDKELLGRVDPESLEKFIELTKSLQQAILQSSAVSKDFEVQYSCHDVLGRRRTAKCIRYVTKPVT